MDGAQKIKLQLVLKLNLQDKALVKKTMKTVVDMGSICLVR